MAYILRGEELRIKSKVNFRTKQYHKKVVFRIKLLLNNCAFKFNLLY